ncbi:MAG: hypothetical protein AseanaTS_27490 [Candidatus Pelagadaptatus aseana]|uniref:hypothetical protein n=1 Tax=Candidatus Pelagadaptatus aseana TaxID=3120508 RepID=UPI0039B2DA37
MKLKKSLSCILLLIFSHALHASSLSKQTLTLSCTFASGSVASDFLLDLYNEAWGPLGYRVEFEQMKPAEAIIAMREGRVDGSCGRDKQFSLLHKLPNVASLQQSSATTLMHAMAFRGVDISPDRARLTVGYIPVFKSATVELKKMGYGQIVPFDSFGALMEALASGVVDLAVLPDAILMSNNEKLAKNFVSHAIVYSQSGYVQLTEKWWPNLNSFSRSLKSTLNKRDVAQPHVQIGRVNNQSEMIFGCATKFNGHIYNGFKTAAEKIFEKIGYGFRMVHMTRLREQTELEKGNIDGTCARTEYYLRQVSRNALMIDVPTVIDHLEVYSNTPGRQLRTFEDFSPSDRIGIVNGTNILKKELEPISDQVITVSDVRTGLTMLSSGKLDLFVDFQRLVNEHIQRVPLNSSIYGAGRVASYFYYPAIHQKHEKLLPEINSQFMGLIQANGQTTVVMH